MRVFLIIIGGGIGAPLRYLVDKHMKKLHKNSLPLETLLINVLVSFVIGITVHRSANMGFLFGTGFAGSFTTWSTFALESHDLIKDKKRGIAWIYLALTLVLGVSAAAVGNLI